VVNKAKLVHELRAESGERGARKKRAGSRNFVVINPKIKAFY
jgi:hypothetical protein